MKLYSAPRTRAIRARWLLEELEVPYALAVVEGPLALHPLGEVPVLEDGELTLFESSAICLYLADRFPQKRLAPPVDSVERGPYLQWLLFAEVTLEPPVLARLRGELDAAQAARLDAVLTAIERHLHGREFVAGAAFSAADVVLASILHLANTLKLLERFPGLYDYVARHTRRPAVRRAVSG